MPLRLVAASKTDPGLQREQNEDSCHTQVAEDPGHASGLFIVADGMGGYHAGEVASRLAVESIRDALQPLLAPASSQPTARLGRRRKGGRNASDRTEAPGADSAAESAQTTAAASASSAEATGQPAPASQQEAGAATQQLTESLAIEHYGERLRDAVEQSSEVIVRYGREHTDARGLGSTVTVALIVDGRAYIANVGDSRTYLLREGTLSRVTRDHSLVERLVEAGQIEPDEVYDHPNRNLIYRSLGADKADVEVDIFTEPLRAGDVLLLCSDGLWEMVRDGALASILSETTDLTEACDTLIQRANENGGEDNITAVLVRCDEG
jgi:serine/threonine protein phosphatase PrpC